jgi:uncharacterized phage protein gp47/JayE
MPFNRPSLQSLIDRAMADITSRLPSAGVLLRRSNLFVLSRVHPGAMHELYGELDWLSRQILPDQCDDDVLLRWANIFLTVPQKPATFAVGQAVFNGTNGAVIAAGASLQRIDGVEYSVDADAVVTGGVATVSCTAILAGAGGNAVSGTALALISPVNGVNTSGMVAAAGLTNGFDIETADAVRVRLLNRLRQPAQAGTAGDYVNWALNVSGVTRAWCYPGAAGNRTIGLCFVTDGASGGLIPSAATVAIVQAYINTVRPVTANVQVFAPIADPLNFTLSVTPNTLAVQAAVQAELADLISREATPGGWYMPPGGNVLVQGGIILKSHMDAAISLANGETDHLLSVPAGNVTSTNGHIATMGVISWV